LFGKKQKWNKLGEKEKVGEGKNWGNKLGEKEKAGEGKNWGKCGYVKN
jgi:hypothetical protein